jgi:hypothetical protein
VFIPDPDFSQNGSRIQQKKRRGRNTVGGKEIGEKKIN